VERLHPCGEGGLELSGVQPAENSGERVVGGNAVGDFEEGAEPVLAEESEVFDVIPAFCIGDDGTDGDGKDADEVVLLCSVDAWIFYDGEMSNKREVADGIHVCPHNINAETIHEQQGITINKIAEK